MMIGWKTLVKPTSGEPRVDREAEQIVWVTRSGELTFGKSRDARLGETRARAWGVAGQRQGRLSFGTFEVDRESGELLKRGSPLRVQEKPLQLLLLLLEHPGEIVLREDLQRRLWPNGTYVDFDKGLNTAVKKLRYALGDSPDKPVFIETIPRRGYRFIAPVSGNSFLPGEPPAVEPVFPVVADKTESADSRFESTSDTIVRPVGVRKHWYVLVAFLVATIGIVLVRYGRFARPPAVELKNMKITELTDNGNVREMAISPDGLSLAYARDEGLEQSLFLKRVDGGNETQLLAADTVNFAGMEFSPDGHFLYFVRSEKSNPVFGYLCRIPAEGGTVEQLIRDADTPVSFSPDGKQLVYTRGYPRRKVFEVRVANADGTGDHLLTTFAGDEVFDSGPTWSPKNDSIAVSAHLIGQRRRYALYVISLPNAVQTELYGSAGVIGRPLWIEGGRGLLVTLEDLTSHRGQLWTISASSGEAHRITNDLTDYDSAVDLTPDGKRLAVIANDAVSNLWIAGATDLSQPSQITSGEPTLNQVRELSDGRLIAAGTGLWIMNRDGTHRMPITSLNNPEWIEPCGRFFLAVTNTNGEKVLTKVANDGLNETALASGDVLFPACSADGKSAYYMNGVHPEKIRRISIADGSISEIADVAGDTLFGNIVVSPNGKYLAYPYQQYSPPVVELAVIPSGGGTPINQFQVPGFLGTLRWSPDGRALQYVLTNNGASNIWEQSLSASKPKQITHFSSGEIFDFSWTADHEHLLMTRGQSKRDVILLSHLRGE
jgi:DNA-binding winged helix-turn-helix (wHTH) protein/Tol biopolymer transport system component